MFEVRNTELSYTGKKPFVGFYPFLNLKTPDSIAMLQIAGINGNLYYRGKQSANVTMSGVGWAKIRDSANWGVSLYDNSSGNNGTVTLNESSANFDYIEIFFTDNNKNKYNSVKVFSPNGKNVDLHLIGGWTDGTNALTDIRSKRMTISGTSIAISSSGGNLTYSYVNISAKNIIQHEHVNYIYITKVIGYR